MNYSAPTYLSADKREAVVRRSASPSRMHTGKTALIVEGGGLRGIFAAGVLNAFSETGFDPFDLYIGVSAGANNLSSFVAQQAQRNYQVYTRHALNPEFVNWGKYLRGGHLMDLDWLWEVSLRDTPFDYDAALAHTAEREFYIVTTSLDEGKPLYLRPGRETWATYLKASSAVPIAYRKVLEVEGHRVTDGGVSDPLPAEEAYRRGARRLLVIRSRPLSCTASFSLEALVLHLHFRRYPAMHTLTRNQNAIYTSALNFMAKPPEDAEVVQIAPPQALQTRRSVRNPAAMEADYMLGQALGREVATRLLTQWQPKNRSQYQSQKAGSPALPGAHS